MTKRIIFSLFILISAITYAQQGNASVYSVYGLGDIKPSQTIESRSMGGVNIQADSTRLNFQNPAAYGKLSLTTFNIGGTTSSIRVSDQNVSGKASRSSFDYIAVGIPLGKLGVGFGLKPYSSVGYNITSSNGTYPQTTDSGKGGVNTVYVATGLKLAPSLYWGIEGNYNFGTISTNRYSQFQYIQLGTQTITRSDVTGGGFETGLIYSYKTASKNSWYSSISYASKTKTNSTNTQTLNSIEISSQGLFSVYDKKDVPVSNVTTYIPAKTTLGLGYGEDNKWFVGAQVSYQWSNQSSNRLSGASNASFMNASKIALGGHYTASNSSFSDYYKRVTYRAGFRTENSPLVINNTNIKETGITFGLGLPLGYSFSNINIGAEYGTRGTTKSGLVKERFFNIMIGLSLNDKWFKKNKIE